MPIPTRAVFSVAEIATLAGISKRRAERMLSSNGIVFGHTGNRRIVLLAQIERAMPDLLDSIRFRRTE